MKEVIKLDNASVECITRNDLVLKLDFMDSGRMPIQPAAHRLRWKPSMTGCIQVGLDKN